MKVLVASFLALLSTGLSACPSSHFQPTTYFGEAFGDSRPVTEFEFANSKEDLDLIIIEYQTFEPGYVPVFATSILRAESGKFRVALVRAKEPKLKGGKPLPTAAFRELPAQLARRAKDSAALVLRNTRYPEEPCTDIWFDGYVIQALVPHAEGFRELVGEVYVPPADSEAGAIVALGRSFRAFVERKANEADLELAVLAVERHNFSSKPTP